MRAEKSQSVSNNLSGNDRVEPPVSRCLGIKVKIPGKNCPGSGVSFFGRTEDFP